MDTVAGLVCRFVTLPNAMRAKRKAIAQVTIEELEVDTSPQLEAVEVNCWGQGPSPQAEVMEARGPSACCQS